MGMVMGKASRTREHSARQRIAAQQQAARQAERRRRVLLAGGSIVTVLAVVVALVLVKTLGSPAPASAASGGPDGTALPAAVTRQITAVPAGTLRAVGTGAADPASA